MATIPTPRSYNRIMGDMINAFLSRFGIKSLRVGSPILSILESAAQSDLRNSQDIFNLLNADSLDRAVGLALDRKGLDEDTPRLTEAAATGVITVSDTSITKISTKIYSALGAPIIGSTVINVMDASGFTSTGSLYIGRGTLNYEGPIAYGSKVNNGLYWTITLSTATKKYHNLNESVILAQGGNRTVSSGTIVQTPQGNTLEAIQFSTTASATIPDGETSITGVPVIAKLTGVIGNVPAGAINAFTSSPFTGAAVTNPLPFTNAQSAEDDDLYRERIKNAKQSQSKGTALSIKNGVLGIISSDDNKRVVSASVVDRQGYPTTLYIDDGTGYEEHWTGVAQETVVDSALGGEQYLQLASLRPQTKALATTLNKAPFAVPAGSKLTVNVGGILYTHIFSATDFRSVGNATAQEIVASINANPLLAFNARTSNTGTTVTIFAKSETTESIQLSTPLSGVDANASLLFPLGKNDTLKLYKNDRLLSKDGQTASIGSAPQSSWTIMSSGETLTIAIDGTSAVTYTFTDTDFITAGTGYTTLSALNSIDAWVAVFNSKIPGITATNSSGFLTLSSNVGAAARASIVISGGTLIAKGMFTASYGLSSVGASNDYTFNRQTGQLFLTTPLSVGDALAAGTTNTRAFIQSGAVTSLDLTAGAGNVWFVVDGAASLVPTGFTSQTQFSTTTPSTNRMRLTASVSSFATAFSSVQVGDWAIFWDSAFSGPNQGAWRVAAATATFIDLERSSYTTQTGIALPSLGLVFVRTVADVQKINIPAATYTPTALQALLSLSGATTTIFQTNFLRISTNTYGSNGDIALVAADAQGTKLGFKLAGATKNLTSHVASVESGSLEYGTPLFLSTFITTGNSPSTLTINPGAGAGSPFYNSGLEILGLRDLPFDTSTPRFSSGKYHNSNFTSRTAVGGGNGTLSTIVLRKPAINEFTSGLVSGIRTGRVALMSSIAIGPQDSLTVVVDNDAVTKRYSFNTYRRVKPTLGTYAQTNLFKDRDNGTTSLANAFGLAFNWQDFAAFMPARVKTHDNTTKAVLWRYFLLGPDGNNARMGYGYPTAPSSALTQFVDSLTNNTTDILIRLPSGAARTTSNLHNTTGVGLSVSGAPSSGITTYWYILGYSISTASRTTNVVTAVLTLPQGGTDPGLKVGDSIFFKDNSALFGSGVATIATVNTGTATITFTLNGADVGATATPGTISMDTAEANLTGSGVVAGDIVTIDSTALFTTSTSTSTEAAVNGQTGSSYMGKTMRVNTLGAQFFSCKSDANTGVVYPNTTTLFQATNTVPIWRFFGGSSTAIRFYPLASNTADVIATASQALTGAMITGTALNGANAAVTLSSWEEAAFAPTWFSLVDGINYIQSVNTFPTDVSQDYNLTFKDTVNATLAGGSQCDWANEEVRLVPLTMNALVSYLNIPSVTGLSTSATISQTTMADKIQISSQTMGSSGAVQVTSGGANMATATVVGAPIVNVAGTQLVLTINATDAKPFFASQFVALQNTQGTGKTRPVTGTAWTGINVSGTLDASVANSTNPLWKYLPATVQDTHQGFFWNIEKHDQLVCFTFTGLNAGYPPLLDFTGVAEGNIVAIDSPTTWVTGVTLGAVASSNIFWRPTVVNGHYYRMTANSGAATGGTEPTWSIVGGTNSDGGITWTDQGTDMAYVSAPNQGFFRIVRVDNNSTTLNGLHNSGVSTFTVASTAGLIAGQVLTFEPNTANSETLTINAITNATQFTTTGTSTKSHATATAVAGAFKSFWIENPNAIEEVVACNVTFFAYMSSLLPSDKIAIADPQLGTANQGTWTVRFPSYKYNVSAVNNYSIRNQYQVVLDVSSKVPTTTTPNETVGNNLVTAQDPSSARFIKQIVGIGINQSDSTKYDVKLNTLGGSFNGGSIDGITLISASYGTVMSALDKLGFPTATVTGFDAYSYSTGLIGEANRVIYGDPANVATYPGIVADGATVAISGPLVKRIQISLSIRVRTGVTPADVTDKVKNAVAGIINGAGVGEAIAFSDIIESAGSVTGVVAVSIVSPVFNITNDLISVQPFEKALVQNLATDILVSIVGN